MLFLAPQVAFHGPPVDDVLEARADLAGFGNPAGVEPEEAGTAAFNQEGEFMGGGCGIALLVGPEQIAKLGPFAFVDPVGQSKGLARRGAEIQEFGKPAIVRPHHAIHIKQCYSKCIAGEKPLIEPSCLAERVIGLEELEILFAQLSVLAAQFSELVVDEAALEMRKRFDCDEAKHAILFIDKHDVFMEFVAFAGQCRVKNPTNRSCAVEHERMRHLRKMGRAATVERKAVSRAEHEAQLGARAKAGDAALAHQCRELDLVFLEETMNLLKMRVVVDGTSVLDQGFERCRLGRQGGWSRSEFRETECAIEM
jgi:hypothetical protein